MSKTKFKCSLKAYRMEKELSIIELADLVGVSKQTIEKIESNVYCPTVDLAHSIASVFQTRIGNIFVYEEEKNNV